MNNLLKKNERRIRNIANDLESLEYAVEACTDEIKQLKKELFAEGKCLEHEGLDSVGMFKVLFVGQIISEISKMIVEQTETLYKMRNEIHERRLELNTGKKLLRAKEGASDGAKASDSE